MNLGGKAKTRTWVGVVIDRDGYTMELENLDTLHAWWTITRWNLSFGHWHAIIFHNLPDLPKYLWRSLRP
jgi:hypothetical protein